MFWLGLGVGLFTGASLGVLVLGMVQVNRIGPDDLSR
jgi:hypothetical protein